MAVADMGDALGTVSSAYFWEARPEEVHRKTGDFGWQIGWKIGHLGDGTMDGSFD